MKKMSKKLVSFFLVMVLAIMMAIPSFAATYALTPDLSGDDTGLWMNVYGTTGSALSGRRITLYNAGTSTSNLEIDQKFTSVRKTLGTLSGTMLVAYGNGSYAISRRTSDGHAHMWTHTTNADFIDAAFTPNLGNPDCPFFLKYYTDATYGLRYGSLSNHASVWLNTGSSSWDVRTVS